MNERIRALLAQSTKEVWANDPYNGSPVFEGYEVDQEKFAELIVKEVFAKIEDERFEVYEPVKEAVMKHFGIE